MTDPTTKTVEDLTAHARAIDDVERTDLSSLVFDLALCLCDLTNRTPAPAAVLPIEEREARILRVVAERDHWQAEAAKERARAGEACTDILAVAREMGYTHDPEGQADAPAPVDVLIRGAREGRRALHERDAWKDRADKAEDRFLDVLDVIGLREAFENGHDIVRATELHEADWKAAVADAVTKERERCRELCIESAVAHSKGDAESRAKAAAYAHAAFRIDERVMPSEIDVDGMVDSKDVQFIGTATRQADGKYTCLANVGGALCVVEATATPQPATPKEVTAAAADPKHPHLIAGEFQSDKYPTCPRGKVPLSVKDATAQDLLWLYAQRRRTVDAEFADDLEEALRIAGYDPAKLSTPLSIPMVLHCPAITSRGAVCGARHIDEGEFATKLHHTHACQACGAVWRPAIVPTVGVQFLPGFKNDVAPKDHEGGPPCAAQPRTASDIYDALGACVNVDMTGLARALVRVVEVTRGYDWIANGETGSYSCKDDERVWLRVECDNALIAIREVALDALRLSGNIADVAFEDPLFSKAASAEKEKTP